LQRFDRAWTQLDARLCALVLIADAATLVVWIALKSLASTGTSGAGQVFRSLVTALVLGTIAHVALRRRASRPELVTAIATLVGFALGTQWGDAGVAYFGNLLAWLQNASFLVFFGGASDVAKRLTLWLAMLGASVATGQGKHINVDVVMRFVAPRARVPVAVTGWLVAAAVCLGGAWGFFDHIAVVDFQAPVTVPCAERSNEVCPARARDKAAWVWQLTRRDLFLFGRQVSLDARTAPHVVRGEPYGTWLTAHDWNQWLHNASWVLHFDKSDVDAMQMPEDEPATRTPAVTAIPGAGERVFQLLVRECNFIVAFGLGLIGLRFILRSLLAIAGKITIDPNAAHSDDDLEHLHSATEHPDLLAAIDRPEAP